MVPVIETPRLRLRAHALEDLEASLAMWSSPEVTRFIGGKPSSREEVWGRLLRYAGHWSLCGYGYWLIEDKETKRFAGEAGFAEFRREVELPIERLPEVGWALAPWAQGRGLATEAVRAAIDWMDATHRPPRTVCMIDPGNASSFRVAEKCGYREFARASYHGEPSVFFERARPG